MTCNDGYTSDGAVTDQTATCQANGDISSLNACNANTCADQSITNAVGTPFEEFTTGQVVSVVCDDGYYGGGDMTCNGVTGSFDNVPSCNQILCSQPSILFGTLGGTWDSDVADGTCSREYQLYHSLTKITGNVVKTLEFIIDIGVRVHNRHWCSSS